mmetsp:Transcript_6123/g.19822  ORF Transcript_6123/g.19822 Transcript_6123/m.19822 type:complete len:242 (-) Transcript_6123:122-847(-)
MLFGPLRMPWLFTQEPEGSGQFLSSSSTSTGRTPSGSCSARRSSRYPSRARFGAKEVGFTCILSPPTWTWALPSATCSLQSSSRHSLATASSNCCDFSFSLRTSAPTSSLRLKKPRSTKQPSVRICSHMIPPSSSSSALMRTRTMARCGSTVSEDRSTRQGRSFALPKTCLSPNSPSSATCTATGSSTLCTASMTAGVPLPGNEQKRGLRRLLPLARTRGLRSGFVTTLWLSNTPTLVPAC